MKNITSRNVFELFSVKTLPDRKKKLSCLLCRQDSNKDLWELPSNRNETSEGIQRTYSVIFNDIVTPEYIGIRPDQGKTNRKNINMLFVSSVSEDLQKECESDNCQWFHYDDLPKTSKTDKHLIQTTFEHIQNKRGVGFAESILLMQPKKFTIKDAEQTAKIFTDERGKLHMFFRYCRETTSKADTKRFLKPNLKVAEVGIEDKPEGRKGKAATLYEIIK